MLDEEAGGGGLERAAGEGTPERGHGRHARGVAGADVVGGVAEEDRFGRGVAEQFEGEEDGLGFGLVALAGVEADQLIEVGRELEELDGALRALVRLAGHHGGWVALAVQQRERVTHSLELAEQPVVVELLELPVGCEKWRDERVVAHERADLTHEGSSHPRDPLLVVRRAAEVRGEGVAVRADYQLYGVGQRAIEIEEKSERTGSAAPRHLVCGLLVSHDRSISFARSWLTKLDPNGVDTMIEQDMRKAHQPGSQNVGDPRHAPTLEPVTLEGKHVRLEPLSEAHLDDLSSVALDPEIWRWTTNSVSSRDELRDYIQLALRDARAGSALPFATIDRASGRAVGSTRFGCIALEHRRLEIGWTWLGRDYQRTAINTEAKYLMLRHAFEVLGMNRVELKTDVLNDRSRAAILRLGAKVEGILRKHIITDSGRVRDSIIHSIVDDEWPDVRARLEARMLAG